MTTLIILAALLLDALVGEPRRWHPLVGFGHLVTRTEAFFRHETQQPSKQILGGTLAWLTLAAIPVGVTYFLITGLHGWQTILVDVLALYLCLGNRSLTEHAYRVSQPLLRDDLTTARRQVAMIVSRDTTHLDTTGVTRATIESVLENGNDAVLAPLFWFALVGTPGVLLYRLANTLDARWGYRSSQYLYFGRTAAKFDDVLNWLPARLCAIAYSLAGKCSLALRCWRQQAPYAASPNAGPVMAAGAGALGIQLGGSAHYHGQREWRPALGHGPVPQPKEINNALHLLWRALFIWVSGLFIIEFGLLPVLQSSIESAL